MFWADIVAKESNLKEPILVNDAKTPSGKIHVGSLRGVLIHDFVYKAFLKLGKKVHFTYHFDDFDPMDGLPIYLDQEKYKKFMGMPLVNIPAPEGEGSYAEYFAKDFLKVFNSLGAEPEILWSYKDLYKSGKLDSAIKIALDNAAKIQKIYQTVSGSKKKKDWFPFQPVCEKCGKIGTTRVFAWDGKEVSYKCETDMVKWATGCSYEGKISPFGGSGKMPYKVEWPSKWFSQSVTIEGEGKDHASKGGTRDVANTIAREIFKIEPPEDIPYEHFLIGDKKMSSSKGLGSSAAEVSEILPPEVIRFLFARVPYQRAINFDPSDPKTIPDLFDEYDRGQIAYFQKGNPDLAKTWEVSQIREIKEEFNLRFNLITELVKNLKSEDEILKEAEKIKGEKLNPDDELAIRERIKYVKIYLTNFKSDESTNTLSDVKKSLNLKQKELLQILSQELSEEMTQDELQNFIYNKGKDLGLKPVETFQAVYQSLIGKDQGPKAGALIQSLGLETVKEKFKQ